MQQAEGSKKKKRNPPWLLGTFVLLLLGGLFFLQPSNLWKTIDVNSADYTLLLYALSSLNFIAFIIFAFIFVRSLLKLRQERRALQIGSKIKTRLLIYFFAISIMPLIAMSVFSYLFLNRALDRWFTQIPEEVIRNAQNLADEAGDERTRGFYAITKAMAAEYDYGADTTQIKRLASETGVSAVYLRRDGNTTQIFARPDVRERSQSFDEIVTVINNEQFSNPAIADNVEYDGSVASINGGGKIIAVFDTSTISAQKNFLENSLAQLDELKSGSNSVRNLGLVTLGLLTFLLMFASSWMAFYVAKGLTRPIRALAEGAEQLSLGNYGYRVRVLAEDELEMLVSAFNEMSLKLKENSEELGARRKYIETVLQSLSTGVISFDYDDRVTTINEAARKMFRLEDADFVGFALDRVVSKENESVLTRLIARAKRIGQASEQTTLLRETNDGINEKSVELPALISATALSDSNGIVIVIEDLSETIAAQRALAWREVARRMAHEIKNPLTPIQLSAERIAKRFASSNAVSNDDHESKKDKKIIKEGTETIIREVSSLKSMVNEFSRFARLPNAKLEPGDLNNVIEQTVTLYRDRSEGIKISTTYDKMLPDIQLDEEQIKRVFVNLIENSTESFDADQKDKRITILTRFDPARDLILAEIADNGKGIEPPDFQKLFQPYFSTKGRGTGLGLAIVQRIVLDHKGKIRAEPLSPRGAKFVLELPVTETRAK